MNIINILMVVLLCGLLTACGTEKKVPQVIIPAVQLNALDKAKNLANELLKLPQQKEKQLKEQGL